MGNMGYVAPPPPPPYESTLSPDQRQWPTLQCTIEQYADTNHWCYRGLEHFENKNNV